MGASKIRSDFDGLTQLGKQFSQQAEATRNMTSNLKQKMDVLRGKDWVGKGATKFYGEMDSALFPTLKRLSTAMDSAGRTTLKIRDIMKRAEDDATALFRGGIDGSGASAGGTGSGAASGGAADGAGTSSGGQGGGSGTGGTPSGSGSGGTPSGGGASNSNPLLARDPNSLFTDQYMRSIVGSQFEGADSAALRNAMNNLSGNPTPAQRDAALEQIAQLRGRPVDQIRAEYDKFLQAKAQRDAAGGEPVPDLNFAHPRFQGSTSQLRYGKIVGDAFGMDPVFGAMLNPTGGLVGPGNAAFDGDSSAVGYHGQVHDAAGYLYNYHQAGPGYDYLGREGRDTSSPLSGQREGIRYWREQLGGVSPLSTPSEYVMRGVVWGVDKGSSVIDRVKSIF